MTHFVPSRNYLAAGIVALIFAILSGWLAWQWAPSYIPAFLFLLGAGVLFAAAFRPPIEITPRTLRVGGREIAWEEIRRIDTTGWVSPLIVSLVLESEEKVWLVYPGDLDSAHQLLGQLQRRAAGALVDGVPPQGYETAAQGAGEGSKRIPYKKASRVKYPLTTPEEEAEIERLYQRLKSVGHLDARPNDEG
jgi:hypothetical protein